MLMKFFFPTLFVLLFLQLFPSTGLSQSSVRIPLIISDNGGKRDTVIIGVHPSATYCVDSIGYMKFSACDSMRERELPPAPPEGVFDIRVIDTRSAVCLGQGVKANFRSFLSAAQKDTFRVKFQPGSGGYPFTFTWPAGLGAYFDTLRFVAPGGINFSMLAQNSFVLDNSDVSTIRVFSAGIKSPLPEPAVPSLVSPANNAAEQDTMLTATWNASDGAKYYRVQVSKDAGFSNIIFRDTTSSTSIVLRGLSGGTMHYWRVSAVTEILTSCFATFQFQTKSLKPAIPTLVFPADAASGVPTNAVLRWSRSAGASEYQVQISGDNFSTILKDTVVTDTSVTVPGLENCLSYQWKVQAKNESGESGYSSSRRFTTVLTTPEVPTQIAPLDEATEVAASVTLSWTRNICAQAYLLEVARDNNFTDIVLSQSLADSFNNVGPLSGETMYFWRVRASNPVDTSEYSAVRRFTTAVFPPSVPVLTSPANGAVVSSLTPTVSWNPSENNAVTYHLQVDTAADFPSSSVVDDNSLTATSFTLPTLTNCIVYFWRVSATNSAGTSAFSSVRSFQAPSVVPSVPSLVAPADNAVDAGPQPTLQWSSSDACSKRFVLHVAQDASFNIIIRRDTVTVLSKQLGPLGGETDYFWRVASLNDAGMSAFTGARKFTTGIFVPSIPSLVAPINNALLPDNAPRLVWGKSTNNPRTYQLQVDTSASFSAPFVNDSTLTDTTIQLPPLIVCETYFWRVRAKNPAGTTAFSGSRSFRTPTNVPPNPPVLLFPEDRQDSLDDVLTLRWSPTAPCTDRFFLDVAIDSTFGTIVLSETLTAASREIGPLASQTTYFWRVKAVNAFGVSSPAIHRFLTTPATRPPIPALQSPSNGSVNVSVQPTLEWLAALRATGYRLQVALDPGFDTLVDDDSSLTVTSKALRPLLNSKTYYWRVNARNSVGVSDYSTTFSFTTLSPPAAPFLYSPSNGETNVSIPTTFNWSIPSGGVSYHLELSKDQAFTNLVFVDSAISVPSVQGPELAGRTRYFWRVRSRNEAGWGVFSSVSSFVTTPIGIPNWAIPILISETGPARDTLFFGVNPGATDGIDPRLGEYELPPPTIGFFDARFIDPESAPGKLGEGVRVNFLGFEEYQQIDTFKIAFQPGTGTYPIRFAWPSGFIQRICDSMVLIDEFNGFRIRERMDLVDSATVSTSSLSSLLIIKWGSFPLVDVRTVPGVEIPSGFALSQNYPNPFNPTTMIEFSIEHTAEVEVSVYDVLGRKVDELVNGVYGPGVYSVEWNGKDDSGIQLPTGIYYVRMTAVDLSSSDRSDTPYNSIRKMLMMK